MRILLAEDSKSIAQLIISLLHAEKHEVEHVLNGRAAVEAYKARKPDMVLMDWVMPEMDGIEATRQIKALGGERWVPLIIMTTLGTEADLLKGFEAGADDFLVKPISLEVLKARITAMQRIALIQDSLFGILDNVYEAIITIDEHGIMKAYNKAAHKIFGYSDAEVLGNNVNMLMPHPYREGHDSYLAHYVNGGAPRIIGSSRKVQGRRKNGEVFPMHLSVTEVKRPNGNLFIGLVRDISEEEAARQQVEYLAWHDALTGLANRAQLNETLNQWLAETPARNGALLFIDLDGFKPINDHLGHEAGDQALITVADRLRDLLGAPHFIGRLGGDEFVVLLSGVTARSEVIQWADKIISAISQPMSLLNGQNCVLGASIGIAMMPDHGVGRTELLTTADAAMYQAKRSGKGKAVIAAGPPEDTTPSIMSI